MAFAIGRGGRLAAWTASRTRRMVFHMKTTLVIDDRVMSLLRQEAARSGRTISELVEAGVRLLLSAAPPKAKDLPPLPKYHGGDFLIDVSDREAIDALDDE